jgi:hypothetical protein
VAGTLLVVTGIIVTTVLVVRRDHCNGVSPNSVCQGYTAAIHWAYPIILLGAGLFLAAALSATNLVQRARDPHSPVARRDDRASSGH